MGLSAVRGVLYLLEKSLGGVGKALGAFLRHPAILFLMAAAYFIYQRWDGMVEGMEALIADLISVWKKAVDWLANYIGSVVDGWTALTDDCKSIYRGMVDWTADYMGKIAQGWKDLTGDLSGAHDKAVNFTVDLMEKAVNGVKDLHTKAVNVLAGMIESLAGVLSRTWEGVKDGFNALVDDLIAAWKRSPLYTMFTSIIDGINEAKKALGISDDEKKETGGLGAGLGVVGGLATAAANTFDLGGLWGNAKDFLNSKISAVPNVNQQTSAVTNSVGKQHNGDVNIDNSQNITVNGNVGDPAELAETMNEHRTTADLSDSGTYLN